MVFPGGTRVPLADLIVLAGAAAVEKAAKDAGHEITVPFTPGRTDASQEQTDVDTFEGARAACRRVPATTSRRRRRCRPTRCCRSGPTSLNLTAPQMTVLVGGMRALGANVAGAAHGVLTDRLGTLTNDFFVNLLAMSTEWKPSVSTVNVYDGTDRATGAPKWTATAVDLVFGATSQLRAISEVYASDDAKEKFVADFVQAWDKAMNNDRFDLTRRSSPGW